MLIVIAGCGRVASELASNLQAEEATGIEKLLVSGLEAGVHEVFSQ